MAAAGSERLDGQVEPPRDLSWTTVSVAAEGICGGGVAALGGGRVSLTGRCPIRGISRTSFSPKATTRFVVAVDATGCCGGD